MVEYVTGMAFKPEADSLKGDLTWHRINIVIISYLNIEKK